VQASLPGYIPLRYIHIKCGIPAETEKLRSKPAGNILVIQLFGEMCLNVINPLLNAADPIHAFSLPVFLPYQKKQVIS